MKITEKYTFFYATKEPFSNWYPVSFEENEIKFNCSEQYMMYHKAKLFNDHEIADKILNTNFDGDISNINFLNEKDKEDWKEVTKKQKELGRAVKGFDVDIWNDNCMNIVEQGLYLKFSQNKDLQSLLLSTKDTIIVEAAISDKIWGVGLSENDPLILDENNWLGLNKLGIALTNTREKIKQELTESLLYQSKLKP
jgi:predicted NAD-dependent protein-ADP-ribosyltransferase YbiA (DUF1768 family)